MVFVGWFGSLASRSQGCRSPEGKASLIKASAPDSGRWGTSSISCSILHGDRWAWGVQMKANRTACVLITLCRCHQYI
jgi:hypothetical protein